MKHSPKILSGILLFSAMIFILQGCATAQNENVNAVNSEKSKVGNSEDKNAVSDDISELMTIIRLPEIPEEAVWKTESSAGSNSSSKSKLTAVLKYSSENAQKVAAEIEKSKAPEAVEIGAESWFPEELIAQSQISGNESLKGTAYGAREFVNAPYGTGRVVRVSDTNYFIVELSEN